MSARHVENKVQQGDLKASAFLLTLPEARIDQEHLSYILIPHMLNGILSTKWR